MGNWDMVVMVTGNGLFLGDMLRVFIATVTVFSLKLP